VPQRALRDRRYSLLLIVGLISDKAPGPSKQHLSSRPPPLRHLAQQAPRSCAETAGHPQNRHVRIFVLGPNRRPSELLMIGQRAADGSYSDPRCRPPPPPLPSERSRPEIGLSCSAAPSRPMEYCQCRLTSSVRTSGAAHAPHFPAAELVERFPGGVPAGAANMVQATAIESRHGPLR